MKGTNMQNAKEFIKKHKMEYTSVDIKTEMNAYLDEMKKGLCDAGGSLLMIPSYITLKSEVKREEPILCVDAGGTNLRITIAKFLEDGSFHTDEIKRYTMPGVESEISAQEFFDIIAKLILPFTEITKNIVISFAYRAKILPNIDCEIVEITKEVKVVGAGGKHLGREVCASLATLGAERCNIIVINDSVATALAGKAEKLNDGYGSFTGTILGTGSNSCYIENICNIAKLKSTKEGRMVINTEAGSYDKIPRGDIDIAYDKSTLNPGIGVFEKMTSGGYIGALSEFTLKVAESEGVFADGVVFNGKLTTKDVNDFLTDGTGVLQDAVKSDADGKAMREILNNIVLRAGRLLALQMAAMAVKACKENDRVCMTVEGTTYDKMFGLKQEALSVLLPYLNELGIEADVTGVPLAVLKGCAIAGLSR
ncbi:MAG: hypothetical protein RR234_04770 [Christensenella sp.]